MGDVDPRGRMRLDAIARFMQDVGHDDAVDDFEPDTTWVVRRVAIQVSRWPRFMDDLAARTWCSGVGQRWAERSTVFGDAVAATALWVYVDAKTLAPRRLPDSFFERWGASAAGRKVSGRLTHADPSASAAWSPWPVRATDLDVLDHVNNAAYWHAVEEHIIGGRLPRPSEAEIEYRVPINRGASVECGVDGGGGALWLRDAADGTVFASVVLR